MSELYCPTVLAMTSSHSLHVAGVDSLTWCHDRMGELIMHTVVDPP